MTCFAYSRKEKIRGFDLGGGENKHGRRHCFRTSGRQTAFRPRHMPRMSRAFASAIVYNFLYARARAEEKKEASFTNEERKTYYSLI